MSLFETLSKNLKPTTMRKTIQGSEFDSGQCVETLNIQCPVKRPEPGKDKDIRVNSQRDHFIVISGVEIY